MSEWISVKERLPEAYIDVLFMNASPEYGCYVGHRVPDGNWTDPEGNGLTYEQIMKGCSHWTPLPEPPKEGER